MDRLSRLTVAVALAFATAGCTTPPSGDDEGLSAAAQRLQSYLRIDTTDGHGDEGQAVRTGETAAVRGESAAVDLLESFVAGSAIETTRLDAGDGRPSWYARLPASAGAESGPTLLLLHHIDVTPAGDGWAQAPFSGAHVDGELWGRGAIDAKGLGIAQLSAMLEVERSGRRRHRAVALFAAAGEETGGEIGVGRWLRERPELFADTAAVLNEGGFNRVSEERIQWWGIETAQKLPLWLRIEAPDARTLVTALDRLLAEPIEWRVTAPARRVFAGLAPFYRRGRRSVFLDLDSHIAPTGPTTRLMPGMENYFIDSLQVNQLETEEDGSAWASIDARLLPGSDTDAKRTAIAQTLGPEVAIETLLAAPPAAASPFDHEVVALLEQVLSTEAPIVEQMIGGVTDSRYFRERGFPAYGFSPFRLSGRYTTTVHAANERIAVAAFDEGVERMTKIVAGWVGTQSDPAEDESPDASRHQ